MLLFHFTDERKSLSKVIIQQESGKADAWTQRVS
jgi:hypothetical protein